MGDMSFADSYMGGYPDYDPERRAGALLNYFEQSAREELNALRLEIAALREEVEKLKPRESKNVSDDEIRYMVSAYIKDLVDGDEVYPSDVANAYCLDGDDVERVMDAMLEEGFFR